MKLNKSAQWQERLYLSERIVKLKKIIVRMFKDCGLSIIIECNLKSVDFLNITFDVLITRTSLIGNPIISHNISTTNQTIHPVS